MSIDISFPSPREVADEPIHACVQLTFRVRAEGREVVVVATEPAMAWSTADKITDKLTREAGQHEAPLCSGDYTMRYSIEGGIVFIQGPRKTHAASTREMLTGLVISLLPGLHAELAQELTDWWVSEERLLEWLPGQLRRVIFDRIKEGRPFNRNAIELVAVGQGRPEGIMAMLEGGCPPGCECGSSQAREAQKRRASEVVENNNIAVHCFDPTGTYFDALLREFQNYLNELWVEHAPTLFDTVVRSVFTELSAAAPTYGIEDLHAHLAPEIKESEADETAEEPEAEAKPTNGDPAASEPEAETAASPG